MLKRKSSTVKVVPWRHELNNISPERDAASRQKPIID